MKTSSPFKRLYLTQEGRRRPFVEDRSLQMEEGNRVGAYEDVNPLYIESASSIKTNGLARESEEFLQLDQEFQHLISVAKDLEAAYHDILLSQDQKNSIVN